MSKTSKDFFETYNGKNIDYDSAFGTQCVDGFKVFCNWAGIPVKATPNGWANGYWLYRDSLKFYDYFEYITDKTKLKNGDWCVWDKGSSCPLSHVAMYYEGQFFGERQGGNNEFRLVNLQYDFLGALRWKGWSEAMNTGKAKGCDVSEWQTPDRKIIENYDFVIIRAAWGSHTDKYVDQWVTLCREMGKPFGLYHYSYALNESDARAEAEYFLEIARKYKPTVGCWLDMEDADHYKERYGRLYPEVITRICEVWCSIVESAGFFTGIYASLSWFGHYIVGLDRYAKWIAAWGTNDGSIPFDLSGQCAMYQYTSAGGLDKDLTYYDLSVYDLNKGETSGDNPTKIAELEAKIDVLQGKIDWYLQQMGKASKALETAQKALNGEV